MTTYQFFATSPHGTEDLLATEITAHGGTELSSAPGGYLFYATFESAYRLCLWSRIASRVFYPLSRFPAATAEELYEGTREISWEEHLGEGATFAVDAFLRRSQLRHSRFAALKVKDGVVDYFRGRFGARPSVQLEKPDLRLYLLVDKDHATLAVDLSGEGLHRRGYRGGAGAAPLKENLAAAILLRAGWPALAQQGMPLIDPMCGAGTLLIEGALIATDAAPGMKRSYHGFLGWRGHHPQIWTALLSEAKERFAAGLARAPLIEGCDRDANVVQAAIQNVHRCGMGEIVKVSCRDFSQWLPEISNRLPEGSRGLIVTNPPYGERLGDKAELQVAYSVLGGTCRHNFPGWQLSVFSGNPELASFLGLRASRVHSLRNGPIRARLYHYPLAGLDAPTYKAPEAVSEQSEDCGPAQMFRNRLQKNLKAVRRWARREGVTCYRVYDADLPEYAVAIDWYQGRLHVQEYQAPSSIDARRARRRLQDILRICSEVFELSPEQIFLKQRRRQKGASQYGKVGDQSHFFKVREAPCCFLINLSDYLDTGLFLDHRPLRRRIMELSSGCHFLNLFAYTGTASVFAARGGAATTTTVDASRTYLDWARKNFELNRMNSRDHRLVRGDVLAWLDQATEKFDLIFLDPPTFSNSKDRGESFDIQRDHVILLEKTMRLLAVGGTLIFSTNRRKFKLDDSLAKRFLIEDISRQTVPWDFRRRPEIHKCWLFKHAHAGRLERPITRKPGQGSKKITETLDKSTQI